ncbi:hypothetical protein ACRPK2_03875 [Lactococcus garvieae]|uniref:hypothetical protein n=1 Tax=Lactococcus garvieae TaxID=1363 RepID=UPI003D76B638
MKQQLSLFSDENIGKLVLTKEQYQTLQKLYNEGYRYMTYNPDSPLIPLSFWSLKPRMYQESDGVLEVFDWGYEKKHWNNPHALMSAPISNFDIPALHDLCSTTPLEISELLGFVVRK